MKRFIFNMTSNDIKYLKENLELNIEQFFKDNQIDDNKPIDIFKILKKLNFTILYGDLEDYDGIMLADESVDKLKNFSTNKLIAVNSKLTYEHSVFTLAHELSHYLSGKWLEKAGKRQKQLSFEHREKHNINKKRVPEEELIDFTAASILLPKKSFIQALKDYGINNILNVTEMDIKRFAFRYGLEDELIKRRIEEVLA